MHETILALADAHRRVCATRRLDGATRRQALKQLRRVEGTLTLARIKEPAYIWQNDRDTLLRRWRKMYAAGDDLQALSDAYDLYSRVQYCTTGRHRA